MVENDVIEIRERRGHTNFEHTQEENQHPNTLQQHLQTK